MKILRVSIFIVLMLIYGYFAYMTIDNPECKWWEFFCAGMFPIIAVYGIATFLKYDKDYN